MFFVLFCICMFASSIGAITGIGGGIIIKPVIDMMRIMSVSEINFLSGCTVMSMAAVSIIKERRSVYNERLSSMVGVAIGSVIGGILGKLIFDMLNIGQADYAYLALIQSVLILILTVIVLLCVLNKSKLRCFQIQSIFICIITGFGLGMISSFLGIGGGPINLIILYIMFSMNAKKLQ